MLGLREAIPLEGAAGGFPGSTTEYWVRHADGSSERVSTKATGIVLREGDSFEYWASSGGGVGDPLDRATEAVAADVARRLLDVEDARRVYGVVLHDGTVDDVATRSCRAE